MQIVIQANGEQSYHEQATIKAMGPAELLMEPTFDDALERFYNRGEGDFAVLAVVNSLGRVEDRIRHIVDCAETGGLYVVGETTLPIKHRLIGLDTGISLLDITHVHSQEPALRQCRKYLKQNLPYVKQIKQPDTSWSVGHIVDLGDPLQVAIASKEAALSYSGAHVIDGNQNDRGIQDRDDNQTTFWVLGRNKDPNPEATKTILRLRTANTAGSLLLPLTVLAVNGVNMSDLDKLFGHQENPEFLVEIEGGMQLSSVKGAIDQIRSTNIADVLVLGSVKPI